MNKKAPFLMLVGLERALQMAQMLYVALMTRRGTAAQIS
jgi:hypothetical protein